MVYRQQPQQTLEAIASFFFKCKTESGALLSRHVLASSPIQLQSSLGSSTSSSTTTSLGLSSSRLDLGSAESEIVRRNLITDFWSATSLPVNVPLHRSTLSSQHTNDHTIGYSTSDSASSSKFHHLALLVALVLHSSNCPCLWH